MTAVQDCFSAAGAGQKAEHGRQRNWRAGSTTRDCPRVTVRLSPNDHERLKKLADGMALSTYLRMCALGQELPKRRRSGIGVEECQAIAQVLGLLGQSRIANNLNQLAYQANIGALRIDEETAAYIEEAYDHVLAMRQLLLRALGKKA